MKQSLCAILAGFCLSVQAFPPLDLRQLNRLMDVKTLEDIKHLRREHAEKRSNAFDPVKQHISTTGQHAYKPPGPNDQRGPCPGLNSMANHGYLPRNGIATPSQFIDATGKVFGMALDLSVFLAVYGTAFDGNALALNPGFSIGGDGPHGLLDGLGLLGRPEGLSGSHNKYESDTSATKYDYFLHGNADDTDVAAFQDFYDSVLEGAPNDEQYSGLADFHYRRFRASVENNPCFFYSPFAGVLVAPAGYAFPARMMANHSVDFPAGTLRREHLKTFSAISGDSGNFKWTYGAERIPNDWYRRPNNDYSIPAFLLDVIEHGLKHPQLLDVAANLNGVNSLGPVDFGDLTGGAVNTADLANPKSLWCTVIQIIQATQPDILGSTYDDPLKAGQPLTDELTELVQKFACPKLAKVDTGMLEDYPGYNRSSFCFDK